MKIRVSYTLELNRDQRLAVAAYYGKAAPADRAMVRDFVEGNGTGALSDLYLDYWRQHPEADL